MSEDADKEVTSEDEAPTLEDLQAELERTRVALKKANSEAAERRHRLRDLETAEQERQEADMSEQDKLKTQLATSEGERERLTSQLQVQTIRTAVVEAASKLGFANPEDAYKLVIAEADVEVDGEKVSGFKKPLEELAKSGRLVMKDAQPTIGTPATPLRNTQPTRAEEPTQPIIRL